MATINLGRIKPVFRGAYAGGTAYVVDDIVTHGNETFICIQAGTGNATSNASYWTKLAAKGTDGTDVGTTLTTQGDILYRDASGLAKLAAGTSGQFLKTQGSGANPVWSTVAGGLLQVHAGTKSTGSTNTSSNTHVSAGITESITPTSASSKILINYQAQPQITSGRAYYDIVRNGTTYISGNGTSNGSGIFNLENTRAVNGNISIWYIDSPNSTSAETYSFYGQGNGSSYLFFDDHVSSSVSNSIILQEIAQ